MSIDERIERLEKELRLWELGLDALWAKWSKIHEEFLKIEEQAEKVLDVNEWERVDELRQRLNGALELLARFVE